VRVKQPGQVYFGGSELQIEQRDLIEGFAVGHEGKMGDVDVLAPSCLFEVSPLSGKLEGFLGRDGCEGTDAAIWDSIQELVEVVDQSGHWWFRNKS